MKFLVLLCLAQTFAAEFVCAPTFNRGLQNEFKCETPEWAWVCTYDRKECLQGRCKVTCDYVAKE